MIAGIILRRYSKFVNYDVFGIRTQLKTIILTVCICLAIIAIIDIFLQIVGRQDLLCFWVVCVSVLTTICNYLEVKYVIKQNETHRKHGTGKDRKQRKQPHKKILSSYTKNVIKNTTINMDNHENQNKSPNKHKLSHEADELSSRTGSSNSGDTKCLYFDNIISVRQKFRKMTHWSQVVSTSLGYELFINHLESEFSVETMLFITEVC